jgi:two-component system, NtrC family, nitrogen regulation sensor histidine kinase NtrY
VKIKSIVRNCINNKQFPIYLFIATFLSFVFTYFSIISNQDFNSYFIVSLFLIDFILVVALVILVSGRLFSTWIKRKESSSGSRLQTRILVMFSLLSSVPALLIAIFSTIFFQFVIDSWFDKKVSVVLDESVVVAESYLKEHVDSIKSRTKAMAFEVDNNVVRYNLETNPALFAEIVNSLAELNALSEAVIFFNHQPIIRSRFGASLSLEIFADSYYSKAVNGEVVIIDNLPNKIRAMVMLRSIPNSFLVVGKYVDDKVIDHIKKSQGAAHDYNNIKQRILQTQIRFTLLFLLISLLLLLIAIYIGVIFAGKIMSPITDLLYATKRAQKGDFTAKVIEGPVNDEIGNLSRAFNLMTSTISEQQEKLLMAYNEIDSKRKFSEAVLTGVSTGIVVISTEKKISLINKAGAELLGVVIAEKKHKFLKDLLPEVEKYLDELIAKRDHSINVEIQVRRSHKILTLFLKITKEIIAKKVVGYIITFDDMTELAHAQRYAAWSDVARRIAHEVKNPLTPIHLGAERLRAKYKNQVKDPEMFEKYISTITKHVSDIGKIIDEFSRFARMPKAVLEECDLSKIVAEIVFSRKCISNKIKYHTKIEPKIKAYCDQTQLNQLFTNILKNSEESIEAREVSGKIIGNIWVEVTKEEKYIAVTIKDNGLGFNEQFLSRLTEPYFTTRDAGTGLGLAIVKKIVDDHEGKLIMMNEADNKAVVRVLFPVV